MPVISRPPYPSSFPQYNLCSHYWEVLLGFLFFFFKYCILDDFHALDGPSLLTCLLIIFFSFSNYFKYYILLKACSYFCAFNTELGYMAYNIPK